MKSILFLSLLFCAIALPARGELTDADFDKIRLIVKEEVKTEIAASEKRLKEYIDLKIETVNARIGTVERSLNARIDATNTRIDATNTRIDALDKRMDNMWHLMMALFGLVAATIAIPQIIIAYRDKGRKEMQTQIDQLREKIEAMQQ